MCWPRRAPKRVSWPEFAAHSRARTLRESAHKALCAPGRSDRLAGLTHWPAIHNPNVDGLTLISLTLRRFRVKVPPPSLAQNAFIAFVALLALLSLGQPYSAQALGPADVPRGATHSSLHLPLFESLTVTEPIDTPRSVGAVSTESSKPIPEIPGSDVQPIWLLPLGIGAVALGVVFLLVLRRQNRDDND